MYFLKYLVIVLVSALYVECFRVVKRSPPTCGVKSGGGSDGGSSDGDGGEGSEDGGEGVKVECEGGGGDMSADDSSEEDGLKDEDPSIESQVINGEAASENWPWMASIARGTHTCGGSVIDQRHIITAAHCFEDGADNPDEFTIHVGELQHGESGKTYEVESIQIHEGYSPAPDFSDDIAIITLKEPLPDDVVPICLPEGDNIAEGDKLSLIGFGAMQEGGDSSEELQEVHDLTAVSFETCESKLQELDVAHKSVSDKQICTVEEDEEKGSCQGDSGGPLMQDNGGTWTLIGLVSYSVGCSRPGVPTVFTKVTAYQDWINQHIGE